MSHVKRKTQINKKSNRVQRVYKIFKFAQIQYGETALCLSGGAGMGYCHYGVVKALLENDMLPKIISGTSAGAVIAAIVATADEELLKYLTIPTTYSSAVTL